MAPQPGRRRLRSTGRTIVLWGLGGLAGLGVTLTTVLGLGTTDDTAGDLRTRSLPAITALRETAQAASRGQASFIDVIETDVPAEKAAGITAAEAFGRTQEEAWGIYLKLAGDTQQEVDLQKAYLAGSSRARELAAALLSLGPDDPTRRSVLAEEAAQSADGVAALFAIEADVYGPMMAQQTSIIDGDIKNARTNVIQAAAALALLVTAVAFVLLRGARRDERLFNNEAHELRLAGEAAELEGSLQRGLEMASTEEGTYAIVRQALTIVAPDVPSELLLADSSQAHFHQAFSTATTSESSCSVAGPSQCPAAKSGQTWIFDDSTQLDACPHLRAKDEPVWATCVPVSIGGRATGVIRSQLPLDQARPARVTTGLELVARKTGERLSAVRILAKTEAEAQVDPLTGLSNRRTLENQVSDLRVLDGSFVIAFADLDHFKGINDAHGHDTGDRALRLFARVLRDSIRPRDLIARFGGEEFVAVLPDCSLDDARGVAERIRSELARALENATVPPFTVTIGLAQSDPGDPLGDVISRADVAMLQGKSQGRDRVLVAGDEPLVAPTRPTAVPAAS